MAAKSGKATVESGGFTFDKGLGIPPATRNTNQSEMASKLAAMPEGSSFLVPVSPPENIKDDQERAKVLKEQCRAAANRVSGAVRRFKDKNPGREYVIRTVNDDVLGTGVRVWREKDAPAAKP